MESRETPIDRNSINTLLINTRTKSIKLNGAEISNTLSKLDITWDGCALPVVKISMDSQVMLDGNLLTRRMGELCCEECGYRLGEMVGQCSVVCPNCGELNIGHY